MIKKSLFGGLILAGAFLIAQAGSVADSTKIIADGKEMKMDGQCCKKGHKEHCKKENKEQCEKHAKSEASTSKDEKSMEEKDCPKTKDCPKKEGQCLKNGKESDT